MLLFIILLAIIFGVMYYAYKQYGFLTLLKNCAKAGLMGTILALVIFVPALVCYTLFSIVGLLLGGSRSAN